MTEDQKTAYIEELEHRVKLAETAFQKLARGELRLSTVHGSSVKYSPADARLVRHLKEMEWALEEVLEYFEDHADVVEGPDGDDPNFHMQMACMIKQVLEMEP
jgi:exonuclease VII small subunit